MFTLYWSYKGYCGDKFYGDIVAKTAAEYAPKSRSQGTSVLIMEHFTFFQVIWVAFTSVFTGIGVASLIKYMYGADTIQARFYFLMALFFWTFASFVVSVRLFFL